MEELTSIYIEKAVGMDVESLLSLNRDLAKQRQKIALDTWLPEKRARYNAKRRAKDLELVFSTWVLPKNVSESVINIADVPPKVAKKYKRAVTIHKNALHVKDTKSVNLYEEISRTGDEKRAGESMMDNSLEMLDILRKVLPTHNSKAITDVPPHFRGRYDDWLVAENKGISILKYWNLYRISTCYGKSGDHQMSLQYADEALSLIPPLRKGEMPHKFEVMARVHRAHALNGVGDDVGAVAEFRVCMAAIRLLDHSKKVDMTDANDILIRKTSCWSRAIISHLVKIKYREGNSRPCFTAEERLDLMKELGFGMYAERNLKCSSCKKTDLEAKLSLCSACRQVWFCSKACARESWCKGHKETCDPGSGTVQPMKLPSEMVKLVLDETSKPGGVSILECADNREAPKVFCKDQSTGQLFDVLFDEDVVLEETRGPTRAEAEEMALKEMLSRMELHSKK